MIFDLVVVGGGISGSSLAHRMAACGARVLVVEREMKFRDRVRGESLQPWGVSDVRRLGLADCLGRCSAELRWFVQIVNGEVAMKRDMIETTPHNAGMWTFYHPQAQELMLAAAGNAGAEVRRGAEVLSISPGQPARVLIRSRSSKEKVTTRLVAICAGRNPGLRAALEFKIHRGSIPLFLSGVWLTNLSSDVDHSVAYLANDITDGSICGLFPQHGDRARAYFGFHPQSCPRLQGDGDFVRLLECCKSTSRGAIPFSNAKPDGPLASFECADVWVEHPYQKGVALVGDAAACNDPSWGQGLSLSFRDARVLSDALLSNTDWEAAGHSYAEHHDRYYTTVRTITGWYHDLFQRLGPDADARRARALPLIARDATRVPDLLFTGPEIPMHANTRARFFGDDLQAASA